MRKPNTLEKIFDPVAMLLISSIVLGGACFADPDDAAKRQEIEAMYAQYRASFPGIAEISAEEALAIEDREKLVFVDVRKPKEQAVSMLPGAIPDKEFRKNPAKYKDHLVIAYCTISYRSGKLTQKLQKKGIPMINMKGGILAWLHAGGTVYSEGKSVKKLHVYGKKWDLAPSAYKTVW
jgi:sodium/bile acid cotransporter 7